MSGTQSERGTAVSTADRPPVVEVRLLGSFELLIDGRPIRVPLATQRLVAFLALHSRVLMRAFVAGSLWGDSTERHAAGSLRSAIWRLPGTPVTVLQASATAIRLGSGVKVDITEFREAARIMEPRDVMSASFDLTGFERDLLPDWFDEWLLEWRDRWQQVRLHALDLSARMLATAGQFGRALELASTALAVDPLRESAHRTLIEIHLAEGNVVEAVRQYERCRRILRLELDVGPSMELGDLMKRASALSPPRVLRAAPGARQARSVVVPVVSARSMAVETSEV
jgi:DNA-binding SARP family transcriptional activator